MGKKRRGAHHLRDRRVGQQVPRSREPLDAADLLVAVHVRLHAALGERVVLAVEGGVVGDDCSKVCPRGANV